MFQRLTASQVTSVDVIAGGRRHSSEQSRQTRTGIQMSLLAAVVFRFQRWRADGLPHACLNRPIVAMANVLWCLRYRCEQVSR